MGSGYPKRRSIKVYFIEEDVRGAITAHTCDRLTTFPRGVFNDSEESCTKAALLAVIEMTSFNTV